MWILTLSPSAKRAVLNGAYKSYEVLEEASYSWLADPRRHVDFCQDGYDERNEFFEFNKVAWGEVLQNLKRVVEAQTS